jgi:putative hydrolase of the HAD superfamily
VVLDGTRGRGIRGVIFDAVGTLMDPEPSVAAAYAAAAERQGVALAVELVRGRFRSAFARDEVAEGGGPLSTDEATERRRWRRIVAECLPEVPDPDRAFDELWDHFGDPASWRAYPDGVAAIDAVAGRGYAVVVASNFDGRLRGVLRGLEGLARWAGTVVISSEVGRRKPHSGFYEAACERLGCAPTSVLCVGDDRENDLEGPRRAGLRSVLVDRRGPAEGDSVVARLTDLLDRLPARPRAVRAGAATRLEGPGGLD